MTVYEWAALGFLLVAGLCFFKGAFAIETGGMLWMFGFVVLGFCGFVLAFFSSIVRFSA
jgi:hypothetical protein